MHDVHVGQFVKADGVGLQTNYGDKWPGVGIVPAGHVVQGAMRLEVAQRPGDRPGQAGQRPNLVKAILVDLLLGARQLTAAEVLPVRETGVGAGLNVVPADNLDDAAQKIVKAVKGG